MDDARLDEVADRLYGLALDAFTAERDRAAKELRSDGDREASAAVRALRRPTTAAWAVNQLVRERGAEVDQLLELGARLREAQSALSGDDLRRLGRQQHQVLAAMRAAAQAVAAARGQRLSDVVAQGVEDTLRAALATPAAAAAVRSGRLTAELDPAGFGPEVTAAVPAPAPAPAADATTGSRSRAGAEADARAATRAAEDRARAEAAAARAAAQERLRAADDALDDARRRLDDARTASDEAHRRRDELAAVVAGLVAELERARADHDGADRAADEAATAFARLAAAADEAATARDAAARAAAEQQTAT